MATVKIEELGELEVTNNAELREWVKKARNIEYGLYIDYHWMAEQLRAKLKRINGMMDFGRANAVAREMRRAAEPHKEAGARLMGMWQKFENMFGEELQKAKNPNRKPKDTFKFIHD